MLLQSQNGEIVLLPALPSAWPDGSVRGLKARGGFEVDIAWRGGKLTGATLHSTWGADPQVRWGDTARRIALRKGEAVPLNAQLERHR